jgi:hypothetical protein
MKLRLLAVSFLLLASFLRAEFQQDDKSLAWQVDGKDVWRFSFDETKGKPFFHPVGVIGGPALTNFKPEDHPWHYGLWFSWKYINQTNYWEENRQTGRAQGRTAWSAPKIETKPDGSATIALDVTYTHPSGRVDLTEKRVLKVSAPDKDGGFTLDWTANFTAGADGAVLDRTAMPGEPDGRFNGGYAGLSIRMASAPLGISYLSTETTEPSFAQDRWRPSVPAVAFNFTDEGKVAGGIGFLSDPINAGDANAPWYIVNSREMRFVCAAILAPKIRTVEAGGRFDLNYRIAFRQAPWTPDDLKAAHAKWMRSAGAKAE